MIQFARILDVKPLHYVGDAQDLSNVGYDMFVPKFNADFIEALVNVNYRKISKSVFTVAELPGDIEDNFTKYSLIQGESFAGMMTIFNTPEDGISHLDLIRNISIPNGLQFLLPTGTYGEMCTRSSNFPQDTEVTLGYIDNSYTYGSCFQVKIIEQNTTIRIYENEKLGQLILREYIKPEAKEISIDVFENSPETLERRLLRNGGIGSTGR